MEPVTIEVGVAVRVGVGDAVGVEVVGDGGPWRRTVAPTHTPAALITGLQLMNSPKPPSYIATSASVSGTEPAIAVGGTA